MSSRKNSRQAQLAVTLVKAYLLRGQPFPALEPPAGQHVAAVLSGPARAEAVNLLALPLLGLISLEHLLHLFPF